MLRRLMKALMCLPLFLFTSAQSDTFQVRDKLYVDVDSFEVGSEGNEFYLHTGNNIWLTTHTLHRDSSGVYAYEQDLKGIRSDYDKKWKCPYCYQYWPVGKSCGNPDCPSRY
jgi:hypothetical protein